MVLKEASRNMYVFHTCNWLAWKKTGNVFFCSPFSFAPSPFDDFADFQFCFFTGKVYAFYAVEITAISNEK
jgi:hypothetical protein